MNIYLVFFILAMWVWVSLATAFALGRIIELRDRRN